MNKLLKEARLLLLDVRRNVTMPDRNEARIDKFLRATAPKPKSKGGRLRRIKPPGMTTKEIREAVMLRADGSCECSCGRVFAEEGSLRAELDHWKSGAGRRRECQSVENTWALARWCHWRRTRNVPSAEFWNDRFAEHAAKLFYPFTPHITHAQLKRSAP